jgi:hypothetical protein
MLLIDDLSYLDYTNKGVANELGMTGNRNSYGLVTSPLLTVTPDRHCMGLANWKTWCRDSKLEPSSKRWFKTKNRRKRDIPLVKTLSTNLWMAKRTTEYSTNLYC